VLVFVAFVIVAFVAVVVVMASVIMAFVARSFRCFQGGEDFGGIGRAQRFAFQARGAPNKLTFRVGQCRTGNGSCKS